MPQLSKRCFSTASLPPNQAAKAAGLHMYSEQAKPTQATQKNKSQPTHRTTFSWVTQAYASLAQCPWAPTADIIVRSVFHRRNSSTKSHKKNCHQTCRSRHSANLRTNYVAARSQQCAPVCKVAFTACWGNYCPLAWENIDVCP